MDKKNAGGGRGFVNPQRTDESDEEYVTPSDRYAMEKDFDEAKENEKNNSAAEKSREHMKKGGKVKRKKMAKGGVSFRGDGCVERGHTKGHIR